VGGPRALEELIIGAKEDSFSGFFRLQAGKGRNSIEGALVFKDGEGMLANYRGEEEEEVEGSTALPLLLEMANDPGTSIEARSFAFKSSTVDVDQLVRLFPEARVRDHELDPKVLYSAAIDNVRAAAAVATVAAVDEGLEIPLEDLDEETMAKGAELEKRITELETLRESLAVEDAQLKGLQRENEELRNELKAVKDSSLSMVQYMQSRPKGKQDGTGLKVVDLMGLREKKFEEWKDLKVAENLEDDKKRVAEEREELDKRRANIEAMEAHLKDSQDDLEHQISRLEQEKEELNTVWKRLGQETQAIMDSEQKLDVRTKELFDREKDLVAKETEVQEREDGIEGDIVRIQKAREELERSRKALDEREKELDNRSIRLSEREQNVEGTTAEQTGFEESLGRRKAELDGREALMDERDEQL
jgi:hypothetical protein